MFGEVLLDNAGSIQPVRRNFEPDVPPGAPPRRRVPDRALVPLAGTGNDQDNRSGPSGPPPVSRHPEQKHPDREQQ